MDCPVKPGNDDRLLGRPRWKMRSSFRKQPPHRLFVIAAVTGASYQDVGLRVFGLAARPQKSWLVQQAFSLFKRKGSRAIWLTRRSTYPHVSQLCDRGSDKLGFTASARDHAPRQGNAPRVGRVCIFFNPITRGLFAMTPLRLRTPVRDLASRCGAHGAATAELAGRALERYQTFPRNGPQRLLREETRHDQRHRQRRRRYR